MDNRSGGHRRAGGVEILIKNLVICLDFVDKVLHAARGATAGTETFGTREATIHFGEFRGVFCQFPAAFLPGREVVADPDCDVAVKDTRSHDQILESVTASLLRFLLFRTCWQHFQRGCG